MDEHELPPRNGQPITLTIHVDAGAAVNAGACMAGPIKLQLTREMIATLSDEQRDTLSKHLAGLPGPNPCSGPQWGTPLAIYAEPVGEATIETLRTLLDARRRVMHRAFASVVNAKRDASVRVRKTSAGEGEGA